MRPLSCFLSLILLSAIGGCGGSGSTPTNVGLFGNWNVVMYPTGNGTPSYVFGLALSQEGTNYSGGSIVYNGSVPAPSNMCINASTIRATATTSGSNFSMTVTDSTSNTVISVTGTLASQTGQISGTYTNQASTACAASQGTVIMSPQ